jgi:hypothetical protein
MKVESILRGTILSTVVLLAGCFDSTPPTPPTDAEFQLACAKIGAATRSNISYSSIVPACNCFAELIKKSGDLEFQQRMYRAIIDADGDAKAADANAKSYMKSFPENSGEYLVEKSKIDTVEAGSKACEKG